MAQGLDSFFLLPFSLEGRFSPFCRLSVNSLLTYLPSPACSPLERDPVGNWHFRSLFIARIRCNLLFTAIILFQITYRYLLARVWTNEPPWCACTGPTGPCCPRPSTEIVTWFSATSGSAGAVGDLGAMGAYHSAKNSEIRSSLLLDRIFFPSSHEQCCPNPSLFSLSAFCSPSPGPVCKVPLFSFLCCPWCCWMRLDRIHLWTFVCHRCGENYCEGCEFALIFNG